MITYTPPAATVKVRNGLNINAGFIELGGALVRNTSITGVNQSFGVAIDNGNQAASLGIGPGNVGIGANDASGFTTDSTNINVSITGIGLDSFGEDGSGNVQVASVGVQNGNRVGIAYQNDGTGNETSITIEGDNGLGVGIIDTQSLVGITYDQIYNADLNANFGLNVPVGGQFPQFQRAVASRTTITQNASIADYLVYTDSTYSSLTICAWLELYGAGTILLTVDFTDIQGAAQTVAFPLASGAGFFALNPILIACQGGKDVNVNVINTGGVTYDIAVIMMASQNN